MDPENDEEQPQTEYSDMNMAEVELYNADENDGDHLNVNRHKPIFHEEPEPEPAPNEPNSEQTEIISQSPADTVGYDGYAQNLDSNASQADILKELIRPFNQSLSGGILNKELKISNLNEARFNLVVDMSDVALQCANMGCSEFARQLLLVRDTILCASSSLKGFERETQVTTVNIHKLPKEARDNWNIFNTRKDNQQTQNH